MIRNTLLFTLLCVHYLLKFLNRHGLIEIIALHLRTASFLKISCLLKRLNSLGNHLHPKRIDHMNHMGNNDSSPLKIARLSQEIYISAGEGIHPPFLFLGCSWNHTYSPEENLISKTSTGTGRQKRYPWKWLQPISVRMRSCSCVSTPSVITSIPKESARLITDFRMI